MGRWTRIVAGVFVPTSRWTALPAIERHRVPTLEALRRLRSSVVISHFAAATIWEIDVLGDWPGYLDVQPADGPRRTLDGRHPPASGRNRLARLRALSFANPLAANVRETQSSVPIALQPRS